MNIVFNLSLKIIKGATSEFNFCRKSFLEKTKNIQNN